MLNDAIRKTLRVTGLVLAIFIVAVLAILALFDWNTLKHPIERVASATTGRTVSINGKLQVHIWSWTPTVIVNGLVLGNPPWEKARPMATVDRLEIHLKLLPLLKGDVILPRVAVFSPDVYLHQDKEGRANWTFENKAPTNAPASRPTKLPVVRDLLIQDGKLALIDEMRSLKVDGSIQAHEQKSATDPTPFRIQGSGTINRQPFKIRVAGGPLVNLDPEHPYPFDLHIVAGDLEVDSRGRALKPFDLGQLDLDLDLSGKDLAEGFYLTQLVLPNTAPFKLHAHIARNNMKVAVSDIAGTVGESDLQGRLDIDASRKRPFMSGDLLSKQLRIKDLAASLGARPKGVDSLDAKAPAPRSHRSASASKAPPSDPAARLFPDAHLQVQRVRAMDADVKFRATSIDAGTVPIKQLAFRVKLDGGVMRIDPFEMEMPEGRLSGLAGIDARNDIPAVHIDVRSKDIQLEQIKSKKVDSSAPLIGVLQARLVVDGTGDSVHQVASEANGRLTLILPNGQITAALAELTGINVTKGLGLLLTNSNEKAPIRCGVAQFRIDQGTMNAENITFDTRDVLVTGSGNISLGPEELHLEIKGEPKKLRLTRLRTPIEIRGHLADPSFGINLPSTVKQGAVATALATLATPVAAIIAFVDPGLAKDQNCAALIAEADREASHSDVASAIHR